MMVCTCYLLGRLNKESAGLVSKMLWLMNKRESCARMWPPQTTCVYKVNPPNPGAIPGKIGFEGS